MLKFIRILQQTHGASGMTWTRCLHSVRGINAEVAQFAGCGRRRNNPGSFTPITSGIMNARRVHVLPRATKSTNNDEGIGIKKKGKDREKEEVLGYAMDGSKITRYNKKWFQKKDKEPRKIKMLEYREIGDERLNEILEEYPQVAEMNREKLRLVIANAALYGFSPSKVAKILSRYPEFLDTYPKLLPQSAKAWRKIGISEENRVLLFHRLPPLMSLSEDTLSKAYGFLTEYFSNKELFIFIKNNARCLVEPQHSLKSKLDLLWKTYSHSTLNIAKSEAPSRDIKQIRTRHEFLIRTGFFKPMKFHKFLKYQAEQDRRRMIIDRDKYFVPSVIVCSNDNKFLTSCTGGTLTADELAIFEEYLGLQQHASESLPEYDDSEDEDDEISDNEDADEESKVKVDYSNDRYYNVINSESHFNSKDNMDFYY